MNGYGIIIIVALFIIFSGMYELEPAINKFFFTMSKIPDLNSGHARNPVAFSLAVRGMYLIAIIAIAKLFVRRNKD